MTFINYHNTLLCFICAGFRLKIIHIVGSTSNDSFVLNLSPRYYRTFNEGQLETSIVPTPHEIQTPLQISKPTSWFVRAAFPVVRAQPFWKRYPIPIIVVWGGVINARPQHPLSKFVLKLVPSVCASTVKVCAVYLMVRTLSLSKHTSIVGLRIWRG